MEFCSQPWEGETPAEPLTSDFWPPDLLHDVSVLLKSLIWGTLSTSPSSSKSPECVLSFTAIFRAIFVTYFIFYIFLRTSIYFANFVLSSQLSFKEINFNFFDSLVGGKELIIMLISIFFSDSL